ncbi:VOC family protein [Chitinophaga lutea]
MSLLKKIDETNNVLTWFEIPVTDIDRAQRFYETILDIRMSRRMDGDHEAVFFPYNPDVVQATSGRVTGVLSKSDKNSPSSSGTMVYINASPSIEGVLARVEKAGGKVLVPSTAIPAGLIAVILDTEGNKIGLHAER